MRGVRVLVAVALSVLAGFAFTPVFGGASGAFVIALAAVTAAAAAAPGAVLTLTRVPPVAVTLAGAAAVVITAMVVTGSGTGLVDGPWQLLTGAVPAEPSGPSLAAVAVVAGWTTLAAGLLAVYGARPLSAAGPPLACLLLALALGASGPPLPGWYALPVLALLVALFVAARTGPPPLAALAGGAVIVVVAVAAGALLGPVAPVPGRSPADARDLVAAPVRLRTGVSPLQQYLALRDGIRPLRLTGTMSRPGSLLRMATLTRFDGLYWTIDGDFRRAGRKLPVGQEPAGRRVPLTQRVRVEAGELDWLLTAGRAAEISGPGLGVNEVTGDVAVPDDTEPPAGYSASSAITEATVDEILTATPTRAAGPLPKPPAQLNSFVDTAVSGWSTGSDRILALYRTFTTKGGFRYDQSADAVGGHGYFRIQRLLTDKRGTSEQYASAYAAMVRHLGYDARVVMGLRPRYDGDAFVAEGKDVDAWAEVHFAGLGWVGVDPSPRDNPIGTRPDAPQTTGRSTPLEDPLQDADRPPPPPGTPDSAGEDGEEPAGAGPAGSEGPAVPLVAGLVVALAVLLVSAVPAAKAVRRVRRRRAPSDRLAVLGAWRETLDRLQEAGVPVRPTQTTGEVALSAGSVGALPTLAEVVDRAVYAPEEPDPALREDAWAAAARIRGQVRATMPPVRRLRAVLDPRPLLR
ncbi:transglutaminaseTgpA domain-containing protein [Streptosporangium sp. NPDC002524]|uniref:transglutaminase TgpA family protein n=1 Tax=Streptosporangium sp. NPDC002524 TaxID=3154537 RepID=UPI003327C7FC